MEHQVFWSPGLPLESLELMVIEKAFKFYKQNKTATANSLGISIRTLDSKLEKIIEISTKHKDDENVRRQERDAQLARARGIQTPSATLSETYSGVRMESFANAAAQLQVSLPERAQVQEVLPQQAAARGPGRPRKTF